MLRLWCDVGCSNPAVRRLCRHLMPEKHMLLGRTWWCAVSSALLAGLLHPSDWSSTKILAPQVPQPFQSYPVARCSNRFCWSADYISLATAATNQRHRIHERRTSTPPILTYHLPMDTCCSIASLLLASKSPRRRRLVTWLGLDAETAAVDTPESLDTPLARTPHLLAISLAEEKLTAAALLPQARTKTILCFDTIVVLDERVLGKPVDDDEARAMLRALSGRTHQVITGLSVWFPDESSWRSQAVVTDVQMNALDEAAIEQWLLRGEHLGCAGAYNIEGQIAAVSDRECFQNVAGLPLCHLYNTLASRKDLLGEITAPASRCDRELERRCQLAGEVTGE